MKRCAVCRVPARKLTTAYVRGDGGLRRARICNGCMGDTVRLHVADARPSLCSCGAEAAFCHECVRGALPANKLKKAIAAQLRRIAQAYPETERADAMEQAAGIVEAYPVDSDEEDHA